MYVIGYKYQREVFRTSALYLIIEDVDSKEERKEIILCQDSWTNRNPETLYRRSLILESLLTLSKPVAHRTTSWVKKKAFNNLDDAVNFGKTYFSKAEEIYLQEEKDKLKMEVFK